MKPTGEEEMSYMDCSGKTWQVERTASIKAESGTCLASESNSRRSVWLEWRARGR